MGVGVKNVYEAWSWYKKNFGLDIRVFEEKATAELMLPYTGGKPQERHAALAMNLQGGGGFEIWQYTHRTPQPAKFDLQLGDIGIYACKIKSPDIEAAFDLHKKNNVTILTEIVTEPETGEKYFFIEDPYGNIFQIISSNNWRKLTGKPTGGVYGGILGVTDIEKSIDFYRTILGYDQIFYDKTDCFEDLKPIKGGASKLRRVLLGHSKPRKGAFSELLGESRIELIEVQDREPRKIFENRLWGDLGFIHLCFDIQGMETLRKECNDFGSPFTVDTGESFDMGEAAGAFAYVEDPDGTLIEFVETHKVPMLKKLGIYLNLKNRNPEKPLPKWLISAMSINKAKDIK